MASLSGQTEAEMMNDRLRSCEAVLLQSLSLLFRRSAAPCRRRVVPAARRTVQALALSVVAVLVGAPAVSSAAAAAPTLVATATARSVTLKTSEGIAVGVLKSGSYRLVIKDRSSKCGFRLDSSAGIVAQSGRRFVGIRTRVVTLSPGSYRYVCGSPATTRTLRVR